MNRTSLHRPRLSRTASRHPATDTRLLPSPFPTRRWKVHRPLPARPPTGGLSQPMLRPASGAPRHPRGPLSPRPRRKTCGKPMAPRTYSSVAPLGTSLSYGDGMEDTPDPLRTVESVWGSTPFQDSPVFPLGDTRSPRDGRESALPSLRMIERFPHTDRPELPSSPADSRDWRSLAPRPLRPGHGPSIAYTPFPTLNHLGDNTHAQRRPQARRRCAQRQPQRPETRQDFPPAQAGFPHPCRPSPPPGTRQRRQTPQVEAPARRGCPRRSPARLRIGSLPIPPGDPRRRSHQQGPRALDRRFQWPDNSAAHPAISPRPDPR